MAALVVVIAHYVAAFKPSWMAGSFPDLFPKTDNPSTVDQLFTSPVFALGYGGQFAVLIFFVLSGYVLSLPVRNVVNFRPILHRRLVGRYFRLNVPLIITVLLSFALYYYGLYDNVEVGQQLENPWLTQHFNQDLNFLTALEQSVYGAILFGSSALNPPLWTIQVEFIGSIMLLTCCMFRQFLKAAFMIIILIGIFYLARPWFIFYLAIFSGAYLDVIKIERKLFLWVSLIVALYFGAYQYNSDAYLFLPETPFDDRLVYNFVGAIGLVFSIKNGVLNRLLCSGWAQYLGNISYSVYITHFLVLASLSCWTFIAFQSSWFYQTLHLFLYVSLSILVGYLFYRLIDLPSISASKRLAMNVLESLSVVASRTRKLI